MAQDCFFPADDSRFIKLPLGGRGLGWQPREDGALRFDTPNRGSTRVPDGALSRKCIINPSLQLNRRPPRTTVMALSAANLLLFARAVTTQLYLTGQSQRLQLPSLHNPILIQLPLERRAVQAQGAGCWGAFVGVAVHRAFQQGGFQLFEKLLVHETFRLRVAQ